MKLTLCIIEKINSSIGPDNALDLGYIEQGWLLPLDSRSVGSSLDDLLDKIIQAAEDTVVLKAGLNPEDIDSVYMTGGSSSLEMLKTKLKEIFPNSKIISGEKFSSVAKGLAITAQKRYGELTL